MNFKPTKDFTNSEYKALDNVLCSLLAIIYYQKKSCKWSHHKYSTTCTISKVARQRFDDVKYWLDRCPSEFVTSYASEINAIFKKSAKLYTVYRVIEACSYYIYLNGLEKTINHEMHSSKESK